MGTSRATTVINPRTRSQCGITLIELLIVCVIIVVCAAIILPSVNAEKTSRDAKTLESSIADFPLIAQTQAVKLKMPVEIGVQGTSLVMQQVPEDGSTPTQIKSLDLGSTMQVVSAQLNGADVNTGAWEWEAYPDGTTDHGGLGFLSGTRDMALMISPAGDVTWKTGQPPLATDDSWTAGQLATRD